MQLNQYERIIEIVLDWPDVRNALGPQEGHEVRQALEKANAMPEIGAIVVSSRGKAFCAGGNLPAILKLAEGGPSVVRDQIYSEFQGIMRAITQSPVPVITAVDGPAIGFGCDLALAGNITLVGQRGWLAQGWARAGLIPATGGAHLVRRRGGQQAVFWMLAMDKIDGPTLEKWNLAISVEEAGPAALAMANRFAELPNSALRTLVQLDRIEEFETHMNAALDHQVEFLTHPDFAQSVHTLFRH